MLEMFILPDCRRRREQFVETFFAQQPVRIHDSFALYFDAAARFQVIAAGLFQAIARRFRQMYARRRPCNTIFTL